MGKRQEKSGDKKAHEVSVCTLGPVFQLAPVIQVRQRAWLPPTRSCSTFPLGFLSANTNILCKVEPFCTYAKGQDTFSLPFSLTWGTHTSCRMVEVRPGPPPPTAHPRDFSPQPLGQGARCIGRCSLVGTSTVFVFPHLWATWENL